MFSQFTSVSELVLLWNIFAGISWNVVSFAGPDDILEHERIWGQGCQISIPSFGESSIDWLQDFTYVLALLRDWNLWPLIKVEDVMKELQRKSLATAEFDETLGSHVYSVHDLQGFQIDILLWLCTLNFTVLGWPKWIRHWKYNSVELLKKEESHWRIPQLDFLKSQMSENPEEERELHRWDSSCLQIIRIAITNTAMKILSRPTGISWTSISPDASMTTERSRMTPTSSQTWDTTYSSLSSCISSQGSSPLLTA